MERAAQTGKTPPQTLPEAMARTLRHEIGDLLQSVYASVAILQRRLPADWTTERRVLADMRTRAETCKKLLDSVHDFVCPLNVARRPVDLRELAELLVRIAVTQHPQLHIETRSDRPCVIVGDQQRLAQVGEALLANACEAAKRNVWFETSHQPNSKLVQWIVQDDGPGVPIEEFGNLSRPFYTTRHGHVGLGLAHAQRIVEAHGGQFNAANVAQGGFRVQVVLPAEPFAGTASASA